MADGGTVRVNVKAELDRESVAALPQDVIDAVVHRVLQAVAIIHPGDVLLIETAPGVPAGEVQDQFHRAAGQLQCVILNGDDVHLAGIQRA